VREENRHAIRKQPQNTIFYLHCDAGILHERIVSDQKTAAHRPALTPFAGAIAEVEHLLTQRLPLYREVMTHEIDVSHLTPSQAAEQIIELCRSHDSADTEI
jgi:shikimate kinase